MGDSVMVDRNRLKGALSSQWHSPVFDVDVVNLVTIRTAARIVAEAPEIETETCKEGHPSCTTLEVFDLEPGRYALVRLVPVEEETG
jgi:hypothetical protein